MLRQALRDPSDARLQAVVRVQELENEIGCFFDREADGSLHHKAFAGQTADRTVHKHNIQWHNSL